MSAPKCIAILGPTCCWKSAVALRLARMMDAEIISCDSMQVYRGLDIGTAKASPEERREIRHHLIDVLDIHEPYDANRFCTLAEHALAEIQTRGKRAILVGGTGLYARAFIYGFSMMPSDHALFAELDAAAQTEQGRLALLEELQLAAERMASAVPEECRLNPRRLVRTVEVLRLTGQLAWQIKERRREPDARFLQCCIVPELTMVKDRIRQRTKAMLENGWVDEALQMEKQGLLKTPTARQALGYADIIQNAHAEHPDSMEELATRLANKTIQYARRQLTWFRHQHPDAVMLTPPDVKTADDWLLENVAK